MPLTFGGPQPECHVTAHIPMDLLDPQSKSLSNFASIGAKEVQAQHQLWGLPQTHHLKGTRSAGACAAVGALSHPGQAHGDAHLYVTLGRIPFRHHELQWFIIRVINLGDKTRIPGSAAAAK